jgi:hypothetical protein
MSPGQSATQRERKQQRQKGAAEIAAGSSESADDLPWHK